jgi:hypothetical protein
MEQLDYNLLFRWFVGLNMDDPDWDVTVFSKHRERLLAGDLTQARVTPCSLTNTSPWRGLSWRRERGRRASRRQGRSPGHPGNPSVDFRGERRSNATHASTTDPDT